MSRKLFFRNEDSEHCHELDYFQDEMKDEGLTEMTVFEAKRDNVPGIAWCKSEGDFIDQDQFPCGKDCEEYEPCNGKSGKCRHKTHCYTQGKSVTIKP